MSRRSRKKKRAVSPPVESQPGGEPAPMASRLHTTRENVFKVMGIVDVTRSAHRGIYPQIDPDAAVYSLEAAHDLLNGIASELEELTDECGGPPDDEKRDEP